MLLENHIFVKYSAEVVVHQGAAQGQLDCWKQDGEAFLSSKRLTEPVEKV